MFDSHAHVAAEQFDNDRENVFTRAQEAGVKGWIEIGTSIDESKSAIQLAEKYSTVWASVGVHPDYVEELTPLDWEQLGQLTNHHKVVGIGEVGLDYYRGGTLEKQLPALQNFLKLATFRNLPIIFHVRNGEKDANDDLLNILEDLPSLERPRGVLHMFSGTVEQAERYLKLGYYISLSGIVTFRNAKQLIDIAKTVPDDRLLVETDCPYVAPEPHRGQRNEPAYAELVAHKIAELRGVEFTEVERAVEDNTRQLFKINF